MTGKMKANFAGAEFECVDDYEQGKKIEAVIRPEDVAVVKPGDGQLKGEVTSADFKGTFYVTFVQCGQYEMEVHCLAHYKPGTTVGLSVLPDNIHIIPYDTTINNFRGVIDGFADGKGLYLVFDDFAMFVDAHRLYPLSRVSKGRLLDENGEYIDYQGKEVIAFIQPEDADMSDDEKAGNVVGRIASFYYIGDHYSYTIRSDHEIDYVVDDEDLWNQDDKVSVLLPVNKMHFRLA